MNDMESRKFEDAFKDAFDKAEVSPSDNAWTNIELDLEKAEGDKMKRRILFYKLLAAASIAFAMCVAGVGYYIVKDKHDLHYGGVATTKTNPSLQEGSASTPDAAADNPSGNDIQQDPTAAGIEKQARENDASIVTEGTSSAAKQTIAEQSSPDVLIKDAATSGDDNLLTDGNKSSAQSTAAVANRRSSNRTAKQHRAAVNDEQIHHTDLRQNTIVATERNGNVADQSVSSNVNNRGKTDGNINKMNNEADAVNANREASLDQSQKQNVAAVNGNDAQANQSGNQIAATSSHNVVSIKESNTAANAIIDSNQASHENISVDKTQSVATNAVTQQQQQHIAATNKLNGSEQTDIHRTGQTQVDAGDQTVTSRKNTDNATQANPFTDQQAIIARLNTNNAMQTAAVEKLPSRMRKPADFDASKFQPQEDPLMKLLEKMTEEDKARALARNKDENKSVEKIWTSVGFAAGSFNTVNSSVSPSNSFAANNVTSQQAKASGSAYTVGVSMGTRIAKRWVVQGGVSYMTQASEYTSNTAGTADYSKFSAPSVNSILGTADAKMVYTAPYTINNNMQFISVPLQAGYLVVNKRFGLQLNGGIATDMFLQNTLTPEGGGGVISKTTQSSGADSPYRTLNFSGLVGTELSYKFGQHYRLALNPGLRYPFNSIYKSDQPIAAMPLTFDVGLRFRYIFH